MTNTYKRHRFPPDIIFYAVWVYFRFNLSHRDIGDLLAERGIIVTRESLCFCCNKFGFLYAQRLKRKHRGYSDTFCLGVEFEERMTQLELLRRAQSEVNVPREVVDAFHDIHRTGNEATTNLRPPTGKRSEGCESPRHWLQWVTPVLQNHRASRFCQTRVGVGRTGVRCSYSLCREWFAPSYLIYLRVAEGQTRQYKSHPH